MQPKNSHDDHPVLWFDSEQLIKLKKNIKNHEWMQNITQEVIDHAGFILNHDINVVGLASNKNHSLAHNAKILAFAYVLTNKTEYAIKAKEILLNYAQAFFKNQYPLNGTLPIAGRITISAAEEALWAYHMMCAYDWIYNSDLLSAEEHDLIKNMFLIEYKTYTRELDSAQYKDNHTTAENLAKTTYGILMQDQDIISQASTGKMGFIDHIDSVMNSEGRVESFGIGYHFAFLLHLDYAAEIHNRAGYGDLFRYNNNKFKKGIDFIINSTYLDGLKIPQIQTSNSDWDWTPAFQSLFESGYSRYKDEDYLVPILDNLDFLHESGQEHNLKAYLSKWGENNIKRGTYTQMGGPHYIEALIMGEKKIPTEQPTINLSSIHFPESKYIYLREGGLENGIGVFITYNNKAVHSDLGSFQFFALGQELGRESGMAQDYSSKDFGAWYSQRVAHNNVVVDQYSPGMPSSFEAVGPNTKSVGTAKVIEFNPDEARATLQADGSIYPGVNMIRDISIKDNAVYIVDDLSSFNTHIYDWVYRNAGRIINIKGVKLISWNGELGTDYGYKKDYIFNIRRGKTNENFKITWLAQNNIVVDLESKAVPNTEVILADAYWEKSNTIGSIILIRRIINSTSYEVSLKSYKHVE